MTRDNSKNRRYTKEEKEKLIATVSQIKGTNTSNKTISSREKFLIVMETYTMSESDLGKYCRENGL